MNNYSGPFLPPGYDPYRQPQQQYYYQPPNPWYRPVRRNANIACFGLIIVILLGVLMSPVFLQSVDFFIQNLRIESPELLSFIDILDEMIVYILMFIIPMAIIRVWIKIPSRVAFPMRNPRASLVLPAVFICLGASVVGMLTYGLITSVLESVFRITPYMPDMPQPVGIPAVVIYFIRLAVAPAVFEELMFRGVIMQSLRRFGDSFALVCSSILFSLAHHNLVQGPNALILGLVMGFFVLRTGSLKTGMIIHFVNNFLVVVFELVTKDMTTREAGIFSTLQLTFYCVSGLICFTYLLITQSGIFHLAHSNYPVRERKKYALFFLNVSPIIYIIMVFFLTTLQFKPVPWY